MVLRIRIRFVDFVNFFLRIFAFFPTVVTLSDKWVMVRKRFTCIVNYNNISHMYQYFLSYIQLR